LISSAALSAQYGNTKTEWNLESCTPSLQSSADGFIPYAAGRHLHIQNRLCSKRDEDMYGKQ